jgi:Flp pilus assembly protein CpaB
MEPKKIALLVGALVVAAMAAVMAKNMFGQSAAPQAQAMVVAAPVGPEVLVATRMLPVGTIIQADSFRYQPWPKDLVENAYYIKGSADPASLAGTVVRADITAGQPLTQGSLVKPGDRGFLAAALGAGMRAVTVAVSNQTGVAGFVFPGDRVDLVLTQSVSGQGPELKASETFIRNVRVLATDQKVVPDEDDKGNKKVAVAQSVTLEVTPRLAEKIAVAQTIGQLSLSLRSIADNNAELDRAIASGDVTLPKGADPKTTAAIMEQAAARPQDSNTTYVTGADVSRFQRRTVPANNGGSGFVAPASTPDSGAMGAMVSAMMNKALPQGPVVRVARGNNVTEVQLGAK